MLCARRAPWLPAVPGSSAQWPPQYRPPGPRRARGSPRRGQLKTWRPARLAWGKGVRARPRRLHGAGEAASAARPRPEREAGGSGAESARGQLSRGAAADLDSSPGGMTGPGPPGLGPLERPPRAPAEPRSQVPTRPWLRASGSLLARAGLAIGETSPHPEPWHSEPRRVEKLPRRAREPGAPRRRGDPARVARRRRAQRGAGVEWGGSRRRGLLPAPLCRSRALSGSAELRRGTRPEPLRGPSQPRPDPAAQPPPPPPPPQELQIARAFGSVPGSPGPLLAPRAVTSQESRGRVCLTFKELIYCLWDRSLSHPLQLDGARPSNPSLRKGDSNSPRLAQGTCPQRNIREMGAVSSNEARAFTSCKICRLGTRKG